MLMKENELALKKASRIAGLWYLMLAIAGSYVLFVRSQTIVSGDAIATARNIVEKEFLYRTGIVSSLLSSVVFVFLVLALYKLFENVNLSKARLMVALVIVQVPISFVIETFNIAAVMIAKGEIWKSLAQEERQDSAMLFLKIHGYGISILKVFWGLWLLPLGQLAYQSLFIPKILGILLIVGGVGYVLDSLMTLLLPEYRHIIAPFALVHSLGEILIILWLLVKGVALKPPVILQAEIK